MNSSACLGILLLAPLVGSALNGFFLRKQNARTTGAVATMAAAVSFLATLYLFATDSFNTLSFPWMEIGGLQVNWGFQFDPLTAVMALVVTGIGTLIHLYSIGYMSEEEGPYRYFSYLNLFLFSMLVLITANNLPVLFVGWEGVGLCSYLLIGYWYEDLEKSNAGMKAFVVNRIGDAAFLIGMFMCFALFGTLTFSEMGEVLRGSTVDLALLNIAAFFLFVGATGKSAQIPLYVWLPDAMAGPTPVSALIHAATMVTAGIYLIGRMSFVYQVTADTNLIIASIGCLTALFAATIATSQRDIKKVLAYSTVSQLGYMFLAMGVGAYVAGIFHLMTHAFFKALLFLGAGSVIHGLGGEQDICNMGGLRKKLPLTFLTFTVGVAAIAGVPMLSGFFSKDTILFAALTSERGGMALWVMGTITSILTAFYMGRLYFVTFFGKYRGNAHPHESPAVMTLPLIVLAVGSAVTGYLSVPHGLHWMPNFLEQYLVPTVPKFIEEPAALSEHGAMAVAIAGSVLGLLVAFFFYFPGPEKSERAGQALLPIKTIFSNKYWVDELYAILFVQPFQWACDTSARVLDSRLIDGMVHLPAKASRAAGLVLNLCHTGSVQLYLWMMLLGGLVVSWILLQGVVL